jgi:hypothetical protein
MIDVKDLVKTYGPRRALDGLNLHGPRRGPNGAGKTTLADLTHVAWLLGWTAVGLAVARWRFRVEPRLRVSRA